MQARAVRENPLRRSCVSSARHAGESAIWICPAQPLCGTVDFVGTTVVRGAICGAGSTTLRPREYLGSWKMRTGDFVVQL